MIEVKLQGALRKIGFSSDNIIEGIGTIQYKNNGTVTFRELMSDLNVPSEYIAFVLINGIRHRKDDNLLNQVLDDGIKLEIFPLIAAG